MPEARIRTRLLAALLCLPIGNIGLAQEPSPQLIKALSYKPRQSDVTYEQVSRQQMADCSIEERTRPDGKGFWITGKGGQPLRWFADTNRDNKLDRWSYFHAGVEVYRESDTDANGTADEFRWLNTEGLRRGIDKNEDGKIDSWVRISAEESTSEVVAATAGRDVERFARLLISPEEIADLGLGQEKQDILKQRVADAKSQFAAWAAGQNVVTAKSRWTNFGADKPGIVPAGTDGSDKDVVVYENAVALLQNGDEARQLLVGTIIQVGDTWRLVDLPKAISEGSVVSDGVFFSASFNPAATPTAADSNEGISQAMQRLITDLQEVDAQLASSSGNQAMLQARRADVLEKLVSASSSEEDRVTWIRQFADTVSAAAQTGEYPDGVTRLQDFSRKLGSVDAKEEEVAYVVFRTLLADYNTEMQKPKAKYEELQKKYLENLEKFVRRYPDSSDAAEAMLTIGLSSEFAGESKVAQEWYAKASRGFSGTIAGRKASGALRRLSLEGKPFQLQGKRLGGGAFDSSAYLGGPVIYHGWATWCEACKAEMKALKQLQGKYAKDKLRIVGLNFDTSENDGQEFLKENAYPWIHLFDEGGLDSPTAIDNGFLSLPVNVIVDGQGKVVATGVHWTELDRIIGDLVK